MNCVFAGLFLHAIVITSAIKEDNVMFSSASYSFAKEGMPLSGFEREMEEFEVSIGDDAARRRLRLRCDTGCDESCVVFKVGCDHSCDEHSDGRACVSDDPHFVTFDGRKFIFKDTEHDLDRQLYDYMVPCNSSNVHSIMPLKIQGKHFNLMPEKGFSGIEYIMVQLYDYDTGSMYIIWINSIIHGWMKVPLAENQIDVDPSTSLLYHDYNETKQLTSDELMHFGSKFKFLFRQSGVRKVDVDIYIDGKCHITFDMFFQSPDWIETDVNGHHGMHQFGINTECYLCDTCGLLGSHLCDNGKNIYGSQAQGEE